MTPNAVVTLRVATCSYATVAATYESYRTGPAQPDIYAHLTRPRRRYHWAITSGDNPSGRALAKGGAWTRDGAVGKAIAAAHRPGIGKAVNR